MSWEYARAGLSCHTCHQPVAEGEMVRRGDVATANVWCIGCAKARLDDEPPDDIALKVELIMPRLELPESLTKFTKFSKPATGAALRANILNWRDGRKIASGERD